MSAWRVVGKHAVNGVEPGGIIEDLPAAQVETLLPGGHIADPSVEYVAPVEPEDQAVQDMVAEGAPDNPKEGD